MKKPWLADIPMSAELAYALIVHQFPEFKDAQIEQLSEGWDNTVFCVNHLFVFRFPRRKVAVSCMEAENRILPVLASRLSIPIPSPCYVGLPSEMYSYPFAGYRMLPGNAAHTAHPGIYERTRMAASFAEFLKELHHISVPEVVSIGAKGDTIGRMDMDSRVPQLVEYAKAAKDRGLLYDIRPFVHFVERLPRTEGLRRKAVLVHGDLNFRNFLVDADGHLSGVIDWGDVHIGHPALDISIVHSFIPPQGRAIFRKVYGEIDEETWHLAKFRALYTNLNILVSANDMGDTAQVREALYALELALQEDTRITPQD
jgi:aminoglycoside phosphotransferase (APT) family kinase protein